MLEFVESSQMILAAKVRATGILASQGRVSGGYNLFPSEDGTKVQVSQFSALSRS